MLAFEEAFSMDEELGTSIYVIVIYILKCNKILHMNLLHYFITALNYDH